MNRAESLAAIRAEYERLSAEDGAVEGGRSHVFKLANMHELREAHEADNEIDYSGHPRMEQPQGGEVWEPTQDPAKHHEYGEKVVRSFVDTYGYEPSKETVEMAAKGFRGNLLTPAGREAFFQRVAALDDAHPREEPEPNRTAGTSGGRGNGGGLAQRVSDVLAAPRSQEDDNEMFLKGIAHMQQTRGWR